MCTRGASAPRKLVRRSPQLSTLGDLRRRSADLNLRPYFPDLHRLLTIAVSAEISFFNSATVRYSFRNSFRQYSVHLFVTHAVDFSVAVAHDQIWIDLFHIFSHKAQLACQDFARLGCRLPYHTAGFYAGRSADRCFRRFFQSVHRPCCPTRSMNRRNCGRCSDLTSK
jgi:hypothetical protein